MQWYKSGHDCCLHASQEFIDWHAWTCNKFFLQAPRTFPVEPVKYAPVLSLNLSKAVGAYIVRLFWIQDCAVRSPLTPAEVPSATLCTALPVFSGEGHLPISLPCVAIPGLLSLSLHVGCVSRCEQVTNRKVK